MTTATIEPKSQRTKNIEGYYDKLNKSYEDISEYLIRNLGSTNVHARYTMQHTWSVIHADRDEPRLRVYNKFTSVHAWEDDKSAADVIKTAMKKLPARVRLEGMTMHLAYVNHLAFVHDRKGKLVKTIEVTLVNKQGQLVEQKTD